MTLTEFMAIAGVLASIYAVWNGRRNMASYSDLQTEITRLTTRIDLLEAQKIALEDQVVVLETRELRMRRRIRQLEGTMRAAGMEIPPEEPQ